MSTVPITASVPGARIGQIVQVDGADYKVTEINLYHPDRPVLTRVTPARSPRNAPAA